MSRIGPVCVSFLLGVLLASCGGQKPATLEEIAARALPYAPSAQKDAVVESVNGLGLELYSALTTSEQGNIFFSPFSISTALAMTYAGARGDTATGMAVALHLSLAQDDVPAAFGALLEDIDDVGALESYTLDTANSLWGQKDFGFLPSFLEILGDSYGAPLQEVDFAAAAESARFLINEWVAGKTANRIQDLLEEGAVSADTRLVLVNALYFKGLWARMFDEHDTAGEPFTLEDGSTITVPMMHQTAELRFAQNDLVLVLELPYTTGDLSMLLILPQAATTLGDVEEALTAEALALWSSGLEAHEDLDVAVPRFSFTASFRLAEQLGAMGMATAFTASADFSGIAGEPGDLAIGDVFHKAFVEVNEEGTEAAAATAVTVEITSAGPAFVANRPFIFLIRHNLSGTILFLGRVMDPRG